MDVTYTIATADHDCIHSNSVFGGDNSYTLKVRCSLLKI